MDRELLLIELISAKNEVIDLDQKNKNRLLLTLFVALLFCGTFFFAVGTMTHQFLLKHVQLLLYRARIEKLYQFSLIFGSVLMVLLLAAMIYSLFHSYYITHHYQRWATQQLRRLTQYPKIYQDQRYYYLAKKNQQQPKIRLVREEVHPISTTFDDQQLLLAEERQILGIRTSRFLLLTSEPPHLTHSIRGPLNKNIKLALMLGTLLLIGLGGAYQYATSYATNREWQNLFQQETDSQASNEPDNRPTILDGLTTQQGQPPNHATSEANAFSRQSNGDLFITTDYGAHWHYLPLRDSWLRFGSYHLTTGDLPIGQYMDKTYEINPTFSWFLYSPETESSHEKIAVYLLTSHDGGDTWQRNLINSGIASSIRYRKGYFFPSNAGIFAVSYEDPSTSAETVTVFKTTDQGRHWHNGESAMIPGPIQNISFIDQLTGFVATREKLFFTFNGGADYQEALVNIPADYQLGGVDLFQTPNEIIQAGTNRLEGKFHLMRRDDYKIYACLFYSTDQGETWQFQQQLTELPIK